MRAIGFSDLGNRRDQQKLITHIVVNASKRDYTSVDNDNILAQFSEDFGPGIGIAVCGEFDEEERFTYDYYYPYLIGTDISSYEDVSIERHAEKESYAGICDDIKIGVSLIFYLQNIIRYVKIKNQGLLPVKGTSLTLSGLSVQGTIILPLIKNEYDIDRVNRATKKRCNLIMAARNGDEDAIENLTIEDMDTYSSLSKKILEDDIFTLVDTYFMPYGVECDQYSILGEIIHMKKVENSFTGEEVWILKLDCNNIQFDICINEKDLYGEPAIGRRFKGVIWLQGHINFPDVI